MRIGTIIGSVTLSRCHPSLKGARWKLVIPMSLADMRQGKQGTAEEVIIYDELGAGNDHRVGFSEGAEAAMPFRPAKKPVDAYCCCILDDITLKD